MIPPLFCVTSSFLPASFDLCVSCSSYPEDSKRAQSGRDREYAEALPPPAARSTGSASDDRRRSERDDRDRSARDPAPAPAPRAGVFIRHVLGVLKLMFWLCYDNIAREKDRRFRKRGMQATCTRLGYLAGETRVRQRQSFSRMHPLSLRMLNTRFPVANMVAAVVRSACAVSESIYMFASFGSRSVIVFRIFVQPLATAAHVTAGYLSFGPMAQCAMHVLKGLACLPRPASSAQRSHRLRSSCARSSRAR